MEKFINVNLANCPFKDEPCEGCTQDSECDILVSDSVFYDRV